MDGFHWTDMLALLALGLRIFGPKRPPELGRSVGSALRELRRAQSEGSSSHPKQAPTTRHVMTKRPRLLHPARQARLGIVNLGRLHEPKMYASSSGFRLGQTTG